MAFHRLLLLIPLLVFVNMAFVMKLHSSYQEALEQLQKATEDARYHQQSNTNSQQEPQIQRREEFSNWWNGRDESEFTETTLIVGIPAVPRQQRYLTTTVAAIVQQLPSTQPDSDTPWRDNIKVYIINNKPGEDFAEFEDLRTGYAHVPELFFLENNMKQPDRFIDVPDPDDFNNPDDRPGRKVRLQTYDIISLLKIANSKSKYFLFMEDDFPVCPSALDTFYYILRKANIYQPDWKAIRSSYGMNGIFIKGTEMESLASFLDANVAHRPPDGLAVEWMCGNLAPTLTNCENPQRHLTFRWNLYKHIGAVSSLRQTGLNKFPGCWQEYSDLLWEVDGFNLRDCEDDDMSPCYFRPPSESLHRTLDMDGWPYINGYITAKEQYGDIDVALHQRTLRLIYSGPSIASRPSSPSVFNSFLVVAVCMMVWKILL